MRLDSVGVTLGGVAVLTDVSLQLGSGEAIAYKMQYHNRTNNKALAYTQKSEGRCLTRVSNNSNIYLWICKKGHQ
jgi:hypothetical protein